MEEKNENGNTYVYDMYAFEFGWLGLGLGWVLSFIVDCGYCAAIFSNTYGWCIDNGDVNDGNEFDSVGYMFDLYVVASIVGKVRIFEYDMPVPS